MYFCYRRLKQYSYGWPGDRVTMRPFQQCNPQPVPFVDVHLTSCLSEKKKYTRDSSANGSGSCHDSGALGFIKDSYFETQELLGFQQQNLNLPCIIHRPYFHFLYFVEQSRISDIKPWNYKLLKPLI